MSRDLKGFTYMGDGIWAKTDGTSVELSYQDRGAFHTVSLSISAFKRLLRFGANSIPATSVGAAEPPPTTTNNHADKPPLLSCTKDRDDQVLAWLDTLRRKSATVKPQSTAAKRPVSDIA